MNNRPKISVLSFGKNNGRFIKDTVDSVLYQQYQSFEMIIVDGASQDNSIAVLTSINDPRIRWISEPDSGPVEAISKAIGMARGEYFLLCPISDGFVSRNWFQTCANLLDSKPEISLVYGIIQEMSEEGGFGNVWPQLFFSSPPPQAKSYFPFWLASNYIFPELTYCVRSSVFKTVYEISIHEPSGLGAAHPIKFFDFFFNQYGYLPWFVPSVAAFGRYHKNQGTLKQKELIHKTNIKYLKDSIEYRDAVLAGEKTHQFRDGNQNCIKTVKSHELKSLREKILQHEAEFAAFLWGDSYRDIRKSLNDYCIH